MVATRQQDRTSPLLQTAQMFIRAIDYQLSVNVDGEASANPQAIAFVNESKAYLTRRGSTEMWIIDPEGDRSGSFRTGGIDLSAYDTDLPNMTNAVIVDDKLFVVVERLNELPSFSTETDTEIETGQGSDGLAGIELEVRNPTALQYNEATGELFVVGRGNFFESPELDGEFHTGGIEVIDPETFEHTLLIDDGTDEEDESYFLDIEVIDANLGYLLTVIPDPVTFQNVTTLRTFNPTTGMLSDTLFEGLQDIDISLISNGPDGHLWVGLNDGRTGFLRINNSTSEIADNFIDTELVPTTITFIEVPADQ